MFSSSNCIAWHQPLGAEAGPAPGASQCMVWQCSSDWSTRWHQAFSRGTTNVLECYIVLPNVLVSKHVKTLTNVKWFCAVLPYPDGFKRHSQVCLCSNMALTPSTPVMPEYAGHTLAVYQTIPNQLRVKRIAGEYRGETGSPATFWHVGT